MPALLLDWFARSADGLFAVPVVEGVGRSGFYGFVCGSIVNAAVFAVEQVVPDFLAALAYGGCVCAVQPVVRAIAQCFVRSKVQAVAEALFDAELAGGGIFLESGAEVSVYPAANAVAVGKVQAAQFGVFTVAAFVAVCLVNG